MKRIVMSLEIGTVVEEESQRVIDLHRREMFADTLVGEAEGGCTNWRAAVSLSRAGTIVRLSAIAMSPRNVSVSATGRGARQRPPECSA